MAGVVLIGSIMYTGAVGDPSDGIIPRAGMPMTEDSFRDALAASAAKTK